jgi:hypothetical protein
MHFAEYVNQAGTLQPYLDAHLSTTTHEVKINFSFTPIQFNTNTYALKQDFKRILKI